MNGAINERTRRLIGRLVADGIRAGVFRPVETRSAAAIVLGLVDGIALQLTFDPEAFTLTAARRFCQDALMRYLGRAPAAT
jgi:type VI protein secretion system component VasA